MTFLNLVVAAVLLSSASLSLLPSALLLLLLVSVVVEALVVQLLSLRTRLLVLDATESEYLGMGRARDWVSVLVLILRLVLLRCLVILVGDELELEEDAVEVKGDEDGEDAMAVVLCLVSSVSISQPSR